MTKSIFASKTFWVNLLSAVLTGMEMSNTVDYLTVDQQAQFAVVVMVLNIVLRFITSKPVSIT